GSRPVLRKTAPPGRRLWFVFRPGAAVFISTGREPCETGYVGNGGGTSAKRPFNSATVSAAAHVAMPAFHTSDERANLPAFISAPRAAMSNGPAAAPSIEA